MQQHLLLWGDIGTDRKALLAIYLNEEEKEVVVHAFPKEQVDKKLNDELFAWKNGAPFQFPESDLVWHVDAHSESILPREIRVDKPEFIQRAQLAWGKLLMSTRLFKVCKEEIVLHKTLVSSTPEYSQKLWDKTKDLWQKYSDMLKEKDLTWEQTELLKAEVNETFDMLKAAKTHKIQEEKAQNKAIIKNFEKVIEEQKAQLIYPEEWPNIHEQLRKIQADLKVSTLRIHEKKPLFEKIDEIYQSLKSYKKTQDVTHVKERLDKLSKILKGIETTLEKDKESLAFQQEKLVHYTKGKNSPSQFGGLLQIIQTRIDEKEAKVADIKKTMALLEKRLKDTSSNKTKESNDSAPEKSE